MQYRHLLLFLSMSFFPITVLTAQLQKGATIQFGTSDLSYRLASGNDPADVNATTFDSYFAYGLLSFLSDRWAVGGALGAAAVSNLRAGSSVLLPVARYYFNPGKAPLHWFATTSAGVDLTFGSQTRISLNQWNLGGGFNHFLNENVLLEAGANLTFRNDARGFFRYPEFNLGAGLQVYLSPEARGQKRTVVPDIRQGRWLTGLSEAGLSFRPLAGEDVTFSLALSPTVGYFFTDRLVAGLSFRANYAQTRFNSELPNLRFETSALSLGLETFVRYYPGKQERRLRPFVLAQAGILQVNSRFNLIGQQSEQTTRNSWFTARAGAGANLFLGPRVALEGVLTYSLGKGQYFGSAPFSNNRIGLNLGFQFFIGRAGQ